MRKSIGVFDSGIGGFSILRELFVSMPNVEYYYISDKAFCPYGDKSSKQIKERSFALAQILLEKNVDLVLMACNTATAHAIDDLRCRFACNVFVGVEPYLNAINKLSDVIPGEKWLSLTTSLTLKSERYLNLINRADPAGIIETRVIPELVPLIERLYDEGGLNKEIYKEFKSILSPNIVDGFDRVILGCTHYPLIKQIVEEILNVKTIDPSSRIAKHISDLISYDADSLSSDDKSLDFNFLSTDENQWIAKKRNHLDLFKKKC